ncbi:MAG: type II toxin-antitoxin system death-on-curing family toxin [Fimbriimonas sp.]
MTEPEWLDQQVVYALHLRQLEQHGGGTGVRDHGLLDSALNRPINLYAYKEPSIPELGAYYCLGIVKNHPFVDGNKRTGFMAMYVFLGLNGYSFEAEEVDVVTRVRRIAASEDTDESFVEWVCNHSVPMSAKS